MNDFPQELIERIIDDLYDDEPSLIHCSLVCRAWLPATRYHLFSGYPGLHLTNEPNKSSALLELLALGPSTVTQFITCLSLTDYPSYAQEAVDQIWSPRLALLCRLPSIESLSLTGWRRSIDNNVYATIPHFNHLAQLKLRVAKFDSPPQLFGLLEVCAGLTSLELYQIDCAPSAELISYSHCNRIRDLDLGQCTTVLHIFAGDASTSDLQCRHLRFEHIVLEDAEPIARLLRRLGENLEDLSLSFDNVSHVRNRVLRNRLARVEGD
jgi:hypothetical protein